MRLVDDRGRVLDAEYAVEADGSYLALIMDSRSGTSGSRPPRNPDYNQALIVLLERLAQLGAVLVDALVDSRHTQELGLQESDRRLISAPIRLAGDLRLEALRRRMGTAQAKIGQAPDATKGGNATKRIRLRLEVPGDPAGRCRPTWKARSRRRWPGWPPTVHFGLAPVALLVARARVRPSHPGHGRRTALAGGVDRRGAERRHQSRGPGVHLPPARGPGPGGQRSLHLRGLYRPRTGTAAGARPGTDRWSGTSFWTMQTACRSNNSRPKFPR